MKANPRVRDFKLAWGQFQLCFEIADATRLLANSGFESFFGRGRFGAGLGKVVRKADNLAFSSLGDGVIGMLPHGIVRRKLQLLDVGADHALVRLSDHQS